MRRKNRRKWLIGGVCGVFLLISIPRLKTYIVYSRKLHYYQNEIKKLSEENEILKKKIKALKEDPYYAEKILRENYGYVREGEYIYRIKNKNSKEE